MGPYEAPDCAILLQWMQADYVTLCSRTAAPQGMSYLQQSSL